MQNEVFQGLLGGEQHSLTIEQLVEFQVYCSSQSISLSKWIEISLLLLKDNKHNCFHFLNYLEKHQLPRTCYNDYIHQAAKIQIYNNLAALALSKASTETTKEEMEKQMNQSKKFLNSSEKVRMTVQKSTTLTRAFMHFYGGEITKALSFVLKINDEIIKTGQGRNLLIMTTLMLAQINFVKRNYSKSLELYRKCLEMNKSLPIKARLGMAYSYFNLNKFELSRACFQRILQLDPTCIQAYIGIAVIYDKEENYKEYLKYVRKAYEVNKNHGLVLLHLAEHFLFRKQLDKCEKCCLVGLKSIESLPKLLKNEQNVRNDYDEYKGRFNNILGQINHINHNYSEAIKYYSISSTTNYDKASTNLIYNQINLAQAYIHPNSLNYLQSIKILDQIFRLYYQAKDRDNKYLFIGDAFRLIAYLKTKIPPKNPGNLKEVRTAEFYYAEALKYNRNDFECRIQYGSILSETNKEKSLKQFQDALKIQEQISQNDTNLNKNRRGQRVQLLNNIAVLLMENKQEERALKLLNRCLETLCKSSNQIEVKYESGGSFFQTTLSEEETELKRKALEYTCLFNKAILLERVSSYQNAIEIYQSLIKLNHCYIDAYLRIAYLKYCQYGDLETAMKVLDAAEALCDESNSRILKVQRIHSLRAYIQYLAGNSSIAKEILKKFGKVKDFYNQCFDLNINYENIMIKNVELPLLKDFLRPNRDLFIKYCNDDSNCAFGFMALAVLLLTDKKLSKQQGLQYFNTLKQSCSDEIPNILYNMGLFLMSYDDSQASVHILNLSKDKIKIQQVQELIALNHLLMNNFQPSAQSVKKNIMLNPAHLKYRLQLSYVTERKIQKYYYDEKNKTKSENLASIYQLKRSMAFHTFISKINLNDYIRGTDSLQMKDKLKTCCQKIKGFCQERKYYAKSTIETLERVNKEIQIKERQEIDREKIKRERQRIKKQETNKFKQFLEEQDQDDEEQKKKRELEAKKKRLIELAKLREQEMNTAWNELKEKDKTVDESKKAKRRSNTNRKPTQKKDKIKERYSEEEEFNSASQNSQNERSLKEVDSEEDEVAYPKRKRDKEHHKDREREGKQKKKLKKAKLSGDEDEVKEEEEQKSEKSAKMEEEDNDSDIMNKYLIN